jgi:hypothetical protein
MKAAKLIKIRENLLNPVNLRVFLSLIFENLGLTKNFQTRREVEKFQSLI